jgi:hypothetical protein
VSPACTVQNRGPAVVVVFPPTVVVDDETVFRGCVVTAEVVAGEVPA